MLDQFPTEVNSRSKAPRSRSAIDVEPDLFPRWTATNRPVQITNTRWNRALPAQATISSLPEKQSRSASTASRMGAASL